MESTSERKNINVPVVYSKTGLGNFYGDRIEINERLKYDKPLRDFVIKHELGHSKKFDLLYEIGDGLRLFSRPKIAWRLLWFYIRTPSTWTDLSPIQLRQGSIVYDLNLIILYVALAGGITLSIKIF